MALTKLDAFMMSAEATYEYSYVTIYKDGKAFCEGFMKSVAKIMNIAALPVTSIYVFEAEDGSVLIDFYM